MTMRKIILYIAQSIDGYIATADGGVGWLEAVPNPGREDYGYASFLDEIDTVIMGRKTYEQVLGFDMPYPYTDLSNFVLTRGKSPEKSEYAMFIHENHESFFRNLKTRKGKDIWLVGGAGANTFFLEHGLIDEMRIFIMPVVLGAGIPLFAQPCPTINLNHISTKTWSSGVVELRYRITPPNETIS